MTNRLFTIICITIFAHSCVEVRNSEKLVNTNTTQKNPVFKYYNPQFVLDSTTEIRTDGYYEVIERFGSIKINIDTFKPKRPSYGFIHLLENGFCRVGLWNGRLKNSEETKRAFLNDEVFVCDGFYKVERDTVYIEYLQRSGGSVFSTEYIQNRRLITAVLDDDWITILDAAQRKYVKPESYVEAQNNTCYGKFKECEFDQSKWKNHLEENVADYTNND